MKLLSCVSIGMAIRLLRQTANMPVKTLSRITDLSSRTIAATERGERHVSYAEMLLIVDALNVEEVKLREYAQLFEREGLADIKRNVQEVKEVVHRNVISTFAGSMIKD